MADGVRSAARALLIVRLPQTKLFRTRRKEEEEGSQPLRGRRLKEKQDCPHGPIRLQTHA